MIDISVLSTENLWVRLKTTTLPVVLYGMGNGADKILDVMAKNGISASAVFASDEFVRGQTFHGMRVCTYREIQEKYRDFIILLSFGSARPEVLSHIQQLVGEHLLLAPDVPVCGGEVFTSAFYKAHDEEIKAARLLFSDEMSVEVYDAVLSYKLTGNLSFLWQIETPKDITLRSLLSGNYSAYVDLGAYTGDTVREALSFFPSIRYVAAFEPSPKTYAKLSAYLDTLSTIQTTAFMLGAWDKQTDVAFTDGAGRNSTLGGSGKKTINGAHIHSCECDTVDNRISLSGEKLLVKYDVEGAENEALHGSMRLLNNNETDMIVSLYHKSADLFSLPLLVHEILPNHRLYLRKHPGVPAWDINLYVTI